MINEKYGYEEIGDTIARLEREKVKLLGVALSYLDCLESEFTGRNGKDLSGGEIARVSAIIREVKGE